MRSLGALIGARVPERWAARLSGWRAQPGALTWQPEPPVSGSPATGRRLARGVLLFDGRLVETADPQPWDVPPPDQAWADHLHGHAWLDDAAAAADAAVWDHLAGWAWAWVERHGEGQTGGWRPDLVARRLIRQIAHTPRLLRGVAPERSALFFRTLDRQVRYLGWRWRDTRPGIERIEALAGLVYALISLEGHGRATTAAIGDLGRAAAETVQADGSVASRNPEELARLVILLVWAADGLEDAGYTPARDHLTALQRAAPALRALRRADGTLARFHGGRSGQTLALDDALARATRRGLAPGATGSAMGYLRMSAGPALCLVDAAPPAQPDTAHSSALAIDFSHGPTAIIVQQGSGLGFAAGNARASRRIPAHSTMEIAGRCPAQVVQARGKRAGEALSTTGTVAGRINRDRSGIWALCQSTQYRGSTGLTLERRLHMPDGGDRLAGEDTVLATDARTRAEVARIWPPDAPPCPLTARFHLHPDIRAALALSGRAVALTLPDASRWLMRTDAETLELLPSLYFDEFRPKPRATLQIVATSHLIEYWGRIVWSFERLALDAPVPDAGG